MSSQSLELVNEMANSAALRNPKPDFHVRTCGFPVLYLSRDYRLQPEEVLESNWLQSMPIGYKVWVSSNCRKCRRSSKMKFQDF